MSDIQKKASWKRKKSVSLLDLHTSFNTFDNEDENVESPLVTPCEDQRPTSARDVNLMIPQAFGLSPTRREKSLFSGGLGGEMGSRTGTRIRPGSWERRWRRSFRSMGSSPVGAEIGRFRKSTVQSLAGLRVRALEKDEEEGNEEQDQHHHHNTTTNTTTTTTTNRDAVRKAAAATLAQAKAARDARDAKALAAMGLAIDMRVDAGVDTTGWTTNNTTTNTTTNMMMSIPGSNGSHSIPLMLIDDTSTEIFTTTHQSSLSSSSSSSARERIREMLLKQVKTKQQEHQEWEYELHRLNSLLDRFESSECLQ